MPVGFRNAAGVDLEQLFDPDVVGDGPTAPFLRTAAGTPLRFAALSYGSKGPDVGFRTSAGVDVSNLWARAGSASYGIPGLDGKSLISGVTAQTGESGNISATATLTMLPNGNYEGRTFRRGAGTLDFSGAWLPSGASASDYEVQFAISGVTGSASAPSNGAPSYTALTSSRAVSRTATVNAATTNTVNGSMTVTVRLRRISTGQVTQAVVTINVAATGQV